jgi:hypothetical protein
MMIIIIIRQWSLSTPGAIHFNFWFKSAYRNEHLTPRHCSHSFLTSALEGDEWSAQRPGRALPPGKGPPVPIGEEAGLAPETVWIQRLEEKSTASIGDRTPIVLLSSP